MIGWADRLAAAYCCLPLNASGRRTLESSEYVLYPQPTRLEPTGLALQMAPIPLEIDSVYVDELWAYDSGTLVDPGDYVYGDDGILWARPTGAAAWSSSPRANKVTLTAGFALSADDGHSLVAMTAALVQALLDRPAAQQNLATAMGGVSRTTGDTEDLIPLAVRKALDAECVIWSRRVA